MNMNPFDWLLGKNPGYRDLSAEEKEAMVQFVMLWTHFEGEVLRTRASIGRILETIRELCEMGSLKGDAFIPALEYWRNRYLDDGQPNFIFDRLGFREHDRRDYVLAVLQGEKAELLDIAGALLIIVYRIRNNLFHGSKWHIGMLGQRENFTYSSQLLMHVYEAYEQKIYVDARF